MTFIKLSNYCPTGKSVNEVDFDSEIDSDSMKSDMDLYDEFTEEFDFEGSFDDYKESKTGYDAHEYDVPKDEHQQVGSDPRWWDRKPNKNYHTSKDDLELFHEIEKRLKERRIKNKQIVKNF